MGLTFIAAGVSVPDALSGIAVCKEGHGTTVYYAYIQYTVISPETTFGVTNVQTINYNLRIYNIRTTNFGSNLKKYNLKQVKELFPYSAVYNQVCPLWTNNKRFLLQNCLIYDVCRAFVVVTFVAVTFVSFNVSILWHFAGSMFRFVSYVACDICGFRWLKPKHVLLSIFVPCKMCGSRPTGCCFWIYSSEMCVASVRPLSLENFLTCNVYFLWHVCLQIFAGPIISYPLTVVAYTVCHFRHYLF